MLFLNVKSCDHKLKHYKGDGKMKVETVQQFYVLQYLKDNFYVEELKLTLIDRYTIRVKDVNGDQMDFYWCTEEGKVKYKEVV